MNENITKLLVILADKILTECDNLGGPVRDECQCNSCAGWRLAQSICADLEPEPLIERNPDCGCLKCNPKAWWMVVCTTCGNKRCPHATDHDYACTGSNAPGQPGSVYPA
jgi:hypothetical protein